MDNIFKNHFYINLDHRTDRKEQCEEELKKLDVEPNRFSAIQNNIGAIGCTKSHIALIKRAIENDWDYVCIFEDDIVIKRVGLLIKRVKKLLNNDFDVLMLSGNNVGSYEEHDDYIRVSQCFTTGAYIIKKHYYQTWLKNLEESLELLEKTGDNRYCCDMYNHRLQQQDQWWLITPICVYQRADYSDIENKYVDYKNLLLNYDK